MRATTVFLALVGVSLAVASDPIASRVAFAKFMKDHKKTYGAAEFKTRFAEFKRHQAFVRSHDAAAKGYSVAINEFSDLTDAEFKQYYLGYKQAPRVDGAVEFTGEGVTLPTSVDWRTKGAVTPIKNQGQCGSCWSFSSTGSIEGAWALSGKTLTGLSEQNLMDCSTAEGNMGCDGGLMDYAFTYVIKNKGIDTEASYPYTAEDGTCQYNPANIGATISSYKDVTSGSESALTAAIATVGPISVAIDASHMSFQMYSGGVYYEPSCSSSQLDHGVLAIGYGVDGGVDYYLVKNSWGTTWGVNGFIEMSRGKKNNCGIATAASYPIV